MRIKLTFILLSITLAACAPEMFGTPPVDNTPATLRGQVDMSSAPPYLNDPVLGSAPLAVVFFNLDNGAHWYVQTTQGDPTFEINVPPGAYQVVAYGHGVEDLSYVAAGYTGKNPSCGQELKIVTVEPGADIHNIAIADWNWTCGGTAPRQDKPADVSIQ